MVPLPPPLLPPTLAPVGPARARTQLPARGALCAERPAKLPARPGQRSGHPGSPGRDSPGARGRQTARRAIRATRPAARYQLASGAGPRRPRRTRQTASRRRGRWRPATRARAQLPMRCEPAAPAPPWEGRGERGSEGWGGGGLVWVGWGGSGVGRAPQTHHALTSADPSRPPTRPLRGRSSTPRPEQSRRQSRTRLADGHWAWPRRRGGPGGRAEGHRPPSRCQWRCHSGTHRRKRFPWHAGCSGFGGRGQADGSKGWRAGATSQPRIALTFHTPRTCGDPP